jgi:hypothetical protein
MAIYDARPSTFTQLTTTSDWEAVISALGMASGVDVSVSGGHLIPTLDTGGRNAVIADGNILIRGMLWRCDAPVSTPIPAASAQNRIDRLVIRLTRTAVNSATVVQPAVVTGTPSGSPVIPALTQTPTGIWEFPISHWTSTSAGAITGLVDDRLIINDIFHNVTGDAGWSAVSGYSALRYKMVIIGGIPNIHFTGAAQHATSAATVAINSGAPLSAIYQPATIKTVAHGNNPIARFAVDYRTDGILYAISNSNTPAATQAIIDAIVPLEDT